MNFGQYLWGMCSEELSDILLKFFGVFFVGKLCALEFDLDWRMGDLIPELGSFLQFMGLNFHNRVELCKVQRQFLLLFLHRTQTANGNIQVYQIDCLAVELIDFVIKRVPILLVDKLLCQFFVTHYHIVFVKLDCTCTALGRL